LKVSATVTIEDQKITEMLMLRNCSGINDNSPNSYTKCVQCVSSGCHWSSSSKRCDWTHGRGPQLHIQKPEILSLEPNKVSFHGRNNVLLRGRNLESVTKIRIQGDLDCIPKESPVLDRSSDTLRFHIPPSGTKGTVKVSVVTPDDRCHGNSIITYNSQPSCTGIQPTVSWSRKGRYCYLSMSEVTVTGFYRENQQYPCVLEKIESSAVICKIKEEKSRSRPSSGLTHCIMRHDLYEEKRKDITEHNRVNILVPFDLNSTLITCGTFNDGYCEVLDINDITNSIYYVSYVLVGPRQDEKSVAFIVGTSSNRYLLVGKKDDAKPQDTSYSVVTLWNTLQSQAGEIFSTIAEGSDAIIQSTVRDVEFVDGFQRVSPSESYLFLNTKTDSERKVLVLWMNSSKGKKIEIFKSLQAAMIRCCSDKARPVLVACTVIPSVNRVIWAGVFSAQNQQDPENSALALYDISNVKGRVKGFCAIGETPCGSELMLDEKFTPGCPTVLFKSDDERAVFPRMHFDPVDFKHIYIALRKQISLHLSLSLESTGNPAFSCTFTKESDILCDGSDPPAVFPNCSCSLPDQLQYTGGLRVSATVNIEDQKITETLTLTNCSSITDSLSASHTQCVQCVSSGCHWSSSSKRCEWTHGPGEQLHIQDACKNLLSEMVYNKPAILSLEPNKVSFHGRNNVLLRGRNLESVTKIRIQGDLDCIPKESPVFDRSSDTLRFHIPPSGTKGTVKVCVVTPDDRCHGNSIITYSSQPSCTGIQPTVSWSSGGRKIHIQGSNLELVESVTVFPSNKVLKTQYDTSSGDLWIDSHPYDGSGQFSLKLNVGNSTVDCVDYFSYKPDPEFTRFTTVQVANDLQVNIQKRVDMLNLSMSEVTVTGLQGDQQYPCDLEKIESNAVICKIKGESGAVPAVDSLTIRLTDRAPQAVTTSLRRPEKIHVQE
ncbi:hypothetical protein cypCar_00019467, partial [Cyprinus carpio]